MRPLLSEFSYGYSITSELVSGNFGHLIGAPIFPSLIQEGQPGGGYDLHLPVAGVPLYLQVKLCDKMVYRSAAEWNLFHQAYYRLHIRPRRHSDQHDLLCDLQSGGEEVYYVAPHFHTTEELNHFYLSQTVIDNSIWIDPLTIGYIPDDDDHYVAFLPNTDQTYLCSRNPSRLEPPSDTKQVVSAQEDSLRRKKRPINKDFFTRIADTILDSSRRSINRSRDYDTIEFREKRRQTLYQEAQFAAHLSRTLLNAELIIISNAPEA